MGRRMPFAAMTVALAVCGGLFTATGAANAATGRILGENASGAIENQYVVVFKDTPGVQSASGTTSLADTLARKHGAKIKHTYTATVRGFAAEIGQDQARRLAADPSVAYVEQDQVVRATGDQPNPPSWGLDRVDQRDLPLDKNYHYDTTASNVTAYIIDTGVRTSHQDFGGRAKWGTNTSGDGNNTDCNGHGTHVAGSIGGTSYGLAKGASLVAVKVLSCDGTGSNSGVIAGIDWVAKNAAKPAVANMSLGGGANTGTDDAVRRGIAAGVTFAVAAGNANVDACTTSPARTPEAITVGATMSNDERPTNWSGGQGSNYGRCLDIFAPGDKITSSWNTNDSATNTISGTSMATPHVAGAAALYVSANPAATPQQVRDALVNGGTPGKVVNPGSGSPNVLLFTASATPGTPTVTNPGNRNGVIGKAENVQLSVYGGTSPYTWSATGLPAGLSIGSSTGLIAGTPTAEGVSSVKVTATDSAGKKGEATFTWTITATPPPSCSATNDDGTTIPDRGTVSSSVTISGCARNASADSKVEVHISHSYRGDLVIDLVAPDGTTTRLKDSDLYDAGSGVNETFSANLSTTRADGTWKLRVQDAYAGDSGSIDGWTLTL
ncbi:S8 family peptidase [Amycolatopsis japonica]|uniref:S8 family peptidase n=1 Tax=Amycolatopsis japonica TaxID=208439 RepID=UPI003830F9A3